MNEVELQSKIGSQLRILRFNLGFKSSDAFAQTYKLCRTSYWRWENGQSMNMSKFIALCAIHNITPKEFFELIEKRTKK